MKTSYQYFQPKPLVTQYISFQCCCWTSHFTSCIQTFGNHPEQGTDLAASWWGHIPGSLNSGYDVFTEQTGWRRHLSLCKTVFHCILKHAFDLTHHLLTLRCSVQQLTLGLVEQGVFRLLNSLEVTPQFFKKLTNYYKKRCEMNLLV